MTIRRKLAVSGLALGFALTGAGPAAAMPHQHHAVRDWNISADGTGSVTTASGGTVAAGHTLVAYVEADAAGAGSQTATVSGCGQAWHLLARMNAQAGDAEAWYVTGATAQSSCAVTAVLAHSGYQLSVTAADYGAAGTPAAATAHAASGAAAVTVSSVPSGSALWLAGDDWDNAISRTLLAGDVSVHQKLASAGDTYWTQQQSAAASGTQVIGTSAPAGDQWNAVAVVIPPAGQQVQPPAAPAGLTVTGTTSSSASLSWTAPSGTVTGYDVYRNAVKAATVTSGTSYTDTGLAASTTYTYTVSAYNSAGEGPQSSSVQAVTQAPSGGCDLNATTANFAAQFAAASPGQALCLASGNYGTFSGGAKTGMVTVKPQSGASVTMSLDWNNVTFVTVTGVTIGTATIQGNSHDLVISYSTVTPGVIHLVTDQMNNANILIDHDTFPNTTVSDGEGRVWTTFNTVNSNTIGVTVSSSLFTGGDTIDILIEGGAGLQVLNNEFTGMDNRINPVLHSDTIFNYGDGGHNVIKGNWFHDQLDVPACGWAQWDGGHDNVFEDNVISHSGGPGGSDGCYEGIAVLDDRNSVISHNVFEPGTGESSTQVGTVMLGGKTSEGAGSGTVIRDNTLTEVENGDGGLNSSYLENHNLCVSSCVTSGDQGTSAGDLTGSPAWVGGSAPGTFAGFALASGSPGIGAASDGTNMGIELPAGG